jgi:hypothetical protein
MDASIGQWSWRREQHGKREDLQSRAQISKVLGLVFLLWAGWRLRVISNLQYSATLPLIPCILP